MNIVFLFWNYILWISPKSYTLNLWSIGLSCTVCVSIAKPHIFLHHQALLCLSSAHRKRTTMATVILLTVKLWASPLPNPLLSSLNHWNQQEIHTDWPELLWEAWTLVPLMQQLKGGFDLAGERTTFISRQITLLSAAFFWSYRLYWEGTFRWGSHRHHIFECYLYQLGCIWSNLDAAAWAESCILEKVKGLKASSFSLYL